MTIDHGRPDVTLVVPVRNEGAHIDACLASLVEQDYPVDRLEIIVVDGMSTDDTADRVRVAAASDPRIRLLDNPERVMPAGLNLGIQAARGELVGVVSGHSVPARDYVKRCVYVLERTGAASVGGRIVRHVSGPMHRAIGLATSSPVGVGDSAHNYATDSGWVESVFPGFWRREVFDQVGLFDPAMVANEDNELSFRIRRDGGRIWYDPEIRVDYVPRATLGGLFTQYRRYGLGKMRVLRKHRSGLRWRHLVPAAWLGFVVGAGLLGIFVPVVFAIWLSSLAVYLVTIVVASLGMNEPGVGWWRIVAALLTLHVAYGIGTWHGVLAWRG